MPDLKTLIFFPTLNEAGNVTRMVGEIMDLGLRADLLIVDDGSTDGTDEAVRKMASINPALSYIQRGARLGVGGAHIDALRYAKSHGYDVLLTMDADFSHRPVDIPRFLEAVQSADVVIGTRFERADSLEEWNPFRKTLTHLGHFLTTNLLALPFDASGAFRAYRLSRVPDGLVDALQSRDYAFFFESLTLMHRAGLSIVELPIVLPARTYGSSKMQVRHIVGGVYKLFRLAVRLRTSPSFSAEAMAGRAQPGDRA